MTLLHLFRRTEAQHHATRLQAAQEAHERACADVEARRKAKDTRGLHEALERARLALNERMRLEVQA